MRYSNTAQCCLVNTGLGGFSIDVVWGDAAGHVVVTPEVGGESSEELKLPCSGLSFVSGRNVNRVCVCLQTLRVHSRKLLCLCGA